MTTATVTKTLIRPIADDDGERLVRFHHRLSRETTYLRFFSFHPELSETEVHWFTHVDHADREALVAVSDDEIVGVARFDRLPGTAEAEVAIVVEDAWQGRGVGTMLLDRLAHVALSAGVETLTAQTLGGNSRVIGLLRHLGAKWTVHDGIADARIPLAPDRT